MPRRRARPVILTHENADFDAIASLLAAQKLYPDAVAVLPRRINRNGRAFLAVYGGDFKFVRSQDLPRANIERAILVDTQGLTTVKGMRPDISILIIDHHPLSRDLPEGWTYRGELTGATTTLLVEQIAAAGLAVSPIDPEGNPSGKTVLAIDTVQAGTGDTVLIIDEGNSARVIIDDPMAPVRCVIAGIVDEVNTGAV